MSRESARPPKDRRQAVLEMDASELTIMRVSETENQRNAGQSIVQELENKGWVKPDPGSPLLGQSPNGISFNMVRPKADVDAERERNNNRARAMAGINTHPMVKDSSIDVVQETGEEMVNAMAAQLGRGTSENDG